MLYSQLHLRVQRTRIFLDTCKSSGLSNRELHSTGMNRELVFLTAFLLLFFIKALYDVYVISSEV